jgi:hypothetical protein
MANSAGQALVQSGNIIRLVSPDLRVLKTWEGPDNIPPPYKAYLSSISPNGNTLLYENEGIYSNEVTKNIRESHIRILDARTLEVKAGWKGDFSLHPVAVSDRAIVKNEDSGEVHFREFNGAWRLVADKKIVGCPNSVFLDDSQILNACRRELVLLDLEGKVVHRQTVVGKHDGDIDQKIALARDQKIILLALTRYRGQVFDMARVASRTLLVVDVEHWRSLLSIKIDPLPHNDGEYVKFDYDISPDGSRVAVLVNSTVKLYKVPDSN